MWDPGNRSGQGQGRSLSVLEFFMVWDYSSKMIHINIHQVAWIKETIPRKVREAIFIKKELKPTLNRDGGRELSKIYDSLLATPSVRTPPTSRSRGSSVSQHSATNSWRRSRVTLKYSETKCECWRSVLIYLLKRNDNKLTTNASIKRSRHQFGPVNVWYIGASN